MEIIKVILPFFVSFFVGMSFAPWLLIRLYKYKVWRKSINTKEVFLDDENKNQVSSIINKNTKDLKTPRMGGLNFIFSVLATVLIFWIVSYVVTGNPHGRLDFLSRSQTWLPFLAFVLGAFLGLIDDILTIKPNGKGLKLFYRLIFVNLTALFFAYWFYSKLGISEINIPLYGEIDLGFWFIPFFILVFNAIFATSNIDGLDGLAGGMMFIIYFLFGIFAWIGEQYNLSAFSLAIAGGILAFLWYNLAPAKFYMSEVGYNALSFTIVILAFLTKSVLLMPILMVMFLATLVTTILQVFWIRVFKKRLIKIAPLHHHFEAIGVSKNLIVTRYWIITFLAALLSLMIYLQNLN